MPNTNPAVPGTRPLKPGPTGWSARFLTLLLAPCLLAVPPAVRAAEPGDACGLLQPAELRAIGLPDGIPGAAQSNDPGIYKACVYRAEGVGPDKLLVVATVTVSAPGAGRVLETAAAMQKARTENTADELRDRGEFYAGAVMCKVQLLAPAELSKCIGTTTNSVVTLAISRSVPGDAIAYPSLQLDLMSQLAQRVAGRGG